MVLMLQLAHKQPVLILKILQEVLLIVIQQQVNMMEQVGLTQILDLLIIIQMQVLELKQQDYFLVVHLLQQELQMLQFHMMELIGQ